MGFWTRIFTSEKYIRLCRTLCKMSSVDCETARTFSVKEILDLKPVQQKVIVHGWVQAVRKQGFISFVNINDGSCLETLQIIVEENQKKPSYGSSVKIKGLLVKSTHKKQDVELQCETLTVLGGCDGTKYPIPAKQELPVSHSRASLHLRPRMKSFGALLRIRSYATMAIHKFLQENGFFHVNTPIITSNDCEGAGEIFSVQCRGTSSQEGNSEEFFNTPTYLTVSGQLPLEAAVNGLSKAYTFGPCFRAENTNSRCHLSEFHMIEVEQSFITELDDLLILSENLFKVTAQNIMEVCSKDVELYHVLQPKYSQHIEKVLKLPFLQMTYSEAVEIIQQNQDAVEKNVKWGDKLLAEHEQFLLKYCDNIPVFLTYFPIKDAPFYMKKSSDETAACFDLIAPYGGEVCGGSLREDDISQLKERIDKAGLNFDPLLWYLELREHGSAPHGGFGMGFDRLLQTILGIRNIREVSAFPRWARHCQL